MSPIKNQLSQLSGVKESLENDAKDHLAEKTSDLKASQAKMAKIDEDVKGEDEGEDEPKTYEIVESDDDKAANGP